MAKMKEQLEGIYIELLFVVFVLLLSAADIWNRATRQPRWLDHGGY